MNIFKQIITRQVLISMAVSGVIFISNASLAAPGILPKTPLFLTDAVEPNIFYVLDDSGSMEWETMIADGTAGIDAISATPSIGGTRWLYMFPTEANGADGWENSAIRFRYTVPSTDVEPLAWVVKNYVGNVLYYNPSVTYTAWQGVDEFGNALYAGATNAAEALIDPNNPNFGTFDLTTEVTFDARNNGWADTTIFPATYFEWIDNNANGIIDAGDGNVRIEIRPRAAHFPSGRHYNAEILNFANWFQFYRKRSFVAKAALGLTVNNTDAYRMGIDIFNDGHQIDAQTMSDAVLKAGMLNSLYNLPIHCGPGKEDVYPDTCRGTPARGSLNRVGQLFQGNRPDPSPIQTGANGGECQQNFSMLVSDGFWNGAEPNNIGNADQDDSGTQVDGFDGGGYADNFEVTLADVAMHYYEHDLSNLNNEVPTTEGVDEAAHQHLVTYTIGFGVQGTLDSTTDPSVAIWPDPTDDEDDEKIDDMWHAAYNGRGKYLSAQNPVELAQALSAVAEDIAERTATAAAVAVNSARLTSDSVVYLAEFNSNRWQGSLFAFPITNLDIGTLAEEANWEAGQVLDNRNLLTDPRVMITYDGSNGVPFQWNTVALNANMVADLRVNPSGGTDSNAIAEARLEYLRGDNSNENVGYAFRSRPSLLGDLVNSGPVFVGAPLLRWPDVAPFPTASGSRYSDFKNGAAKERQKVVYVGANDGMLHAFNDDTGEEMFAYLPLSLASTETTLGYHYLTNPNYVHNWYLDLTPTISDVSMTTNAGTGWRSILIGGLRGGGRGLFALDITDPTTFTEANAGDISMWEFSDADDSDLGYTYSQPVIALTNQSPARWVAIFGNGYNDQGSGEASLFILDIEKGIDGWVAGDYVKISTGVGTPGDRNGLSSPALADTDGNGTVDRVYAGDLEGNMWAFDLSDSNSSNWGVAYIQGAVPSPLFTTPNPGSQPITAKPVLASHPTIPLSSSPSNKPNLMVFFGTGQYLVDGDKSSTTTQSFFGVWDRGDQELDATDLIEQTFDGAFTDRVLTTNFVDYSTDHGWYFNLPIAGERAVTTPVARTDTVFFNTFIPETNPCSVGGFGFKFAVDMTTGGSPAETIIDINGDGVIDDDDNIGGGSVVISAVRQEGYLPAPVFIEDLVFTGSTANKVKAQPDIPDGRFSWQELLK